MYTMRLVLMLAWN